MAAIVDAAMARQFRQRHFVLCLVFLLSLSNIAASESRFRNRLLLQSPDCRQIHPQCVSCAASVLQSSTVLCKYILSSNSTHSTCGKCCFIKPALSV
jgi:hypothetical protein